MAKKEVVAEEAVEEAPPEVQEEPKAKKKAKKKATKHVCPDCGHERFSLLVEEGQVENGKFYPDRDMFKCLSCRRFVGTIEEMNEVENG